MFIIIIIIIAVIRNHSRVTIVVPDLPLSNLNPLSLIFYSIKCMVIYITRQLSQPYFGNQMLVYVKELWKCVSFIQMLIIIEC